MRYPLIRSLIRITGRKVRDMFEYRVEYEVNKLTKKLKKIESRFHYLSIRKEEIPLDNYYRRGKIHIEMEFLIELHKVIEKSLNELKPHLGRIDCRSRQMDTLPSDQLHIVGRNRNLLLGQ